MKLFRSVIKSLITPRRQNDRNGVNILDARQVTNGALGLHFEVLGFWTD